MLGHRLWIALFALPLLAACQGQVGEPAASASPTHPPGASAPDEERLRVSAMVALDLVKTIEPIKDEVDIDAVVRTVRETLAGRPPPLDEKQLAEVRKRFTESLRVKREAQQQLLAAKNQESSAAFLAGNAKQGGVVVTASGLQYQVLREAQGARPTAAATVRVNYVGRLLDGRTFEDTYAIDHPASFALNQVLPGLGEAIALMPVGGKYRFWLPPNLAYAERGLAGQIEPNSVLLFEIELLEIAAP